MHKAIEQLMMVLGDIKDCVRKWDKKFGIEVSLMRNFRRTKMFLLVVRSKR